MQGTTGIDELRVLIPGIGSSGFVPNTAYEFKVFFKLYSFILPKLHIKLGDGE
jgi:hypothetical protein